MAVFSLNPQEAADGESILPLADAKAHVRVIDDWDDDLIAALRDAAVAAVEAYTSRPLSLRSIVWSGEFPEAARSRYGGIALGVFPVRSVEEIEYRNSAGTLTVLDDAAYRIAHNRQVVPTLGHDWPGDVEDTLAPVSISLTAGYDGADANAGLHPPSPLIAAAKLMLGHLYMNREAVIVGVTAAALPLGFAELCAPFRDPVI